jgi:hypothetical protein
VENSGHGITEIVVRVSMINGLSLLSRKEVFKAMSLRSAHQKIFKIGRFKDTIFILRNGLALISLFSRYQDRFVIQRHTGKFLISLQRAKLNPLR